MDQLFIARWVSPFYMRILHGHYHRGENPAFDVAVRESLPVITPEIVDQLLAGSWREAMTGSWFAGLRGFEECQPRIAELLLASYFCYAGQGHAFAMACFANDDAVRALTRYLETYLPKLDLYYDQAWAMPALMWIDQQHESDHAAPFLEPGGLWEAWSTARPKIVELESRRAHFWACMEYCRANFVSG